MSLKLKKFDMNTLTKNATILTVAKRKSGKSYLIRKIVHHLRDIPVGCVISPTERANKFFSDFVPNMFIHDEYSPELLGNFLKRQKKVTKMFKKNPKIDPRAFIILDDCMYNAKEWIKDANVRYLMFNGRHTNSSVLTTMQYVMGLPPSFRSNFDYVFILREPYVNIRRKLYENFAGMFPTFEIFCRVMDVCTENFGCLVIDNTTRSNKIEDQVFWYRADDPGEFKAGAEVFWEHHYNNYQEEDSDKSEDEGFDPNNYRRGKKINLNIKQLGRDD